MQIVLQVLRVSPCIVVVVSPCLTTDGGGNAKAGARPNAGAGARNKIFSRNSKKVLSDSLILHRSLFTYMK